MEDPLVDSIYEAAVVGEGWPGVLQQVAERGDAVLAALVTSHADLPLDWRLSPGAGAAADAYLRSDAPLRSEAIPRVIGSNWAGFLTDEELFGGPGLFRRDPLMTEWGTPNGFDHGAGTAIRVPNGDVAMVQLHRRIGDPAFDRAAIQRLDALRPHLARAAVLSARWRQERLRSATQALGLLGLPSAVVNAAGRVLAANPLLEAMTGHVVWGAADRMALSDVRAAAMFDDILQRSSAGVTPGVRSFAAGDAQGRDAVVVHLIPVEGEARDLFGAGLTLVAVTRPDNAAPVDAALIQGLFDLTAAEARVAAGLIEGQSTTDLAARNGVGLETVRTQVKAVLGKTGVSRQAELISRFRSVTLPRRD